MSSNPAYLPREHVVRVTLEEAATGRLPSRQRLDQLEESDQALPDGHSLSRFRRLLVVGCEEVAAIRSSGDHAAARRLAAARVAELAVNMTAEERDATEPNPEPVDEIALRMFSR